MSSSLNESKNSATTKSKNSATNKCHLPSPTISLGDAATCTAQIPLAGPWDPCTGKQLAYQHTHTLTLARGRRKGWAQHTQSRAAAKLLWMLLQLNWMFPLPCGDIYTSYKYHTRYKVHLLLCSLGHGWFQPTTWYGWGMPIPANVLTSTRYGLLPYCYSNQHSRDLTKCQLYCAAKQREISSRLCLTWLRTKLKWLTIWKGGSTQIKLLCLLLRKFKYVPLNPIWKILLVIPIFMCLFFCIETCTKHAIIFM